MKLLITVCCMAIVSSTACAQQTPLPHGMIFGQRPDTSQAVAAEKAAAFMGKKPRIITTIKGKVVAVLKQKGGWFSLDAGGGKVISAHFKNYYVTLPAAVKGRIVIAEGIAFKPFNNAAGQPGAPNTTRGKPRAVKNNSSAVSFEVSGLMIFQ